jgi:hypothetical protein
MTIDWRDHWWWLSSFLVAFLAVGLPYWQIPYNKLNLPDAVLGAGLLVVGAAALLTRIYSGRHFLLVVVVMGAAVPAAVMARVLFDVMRDPTSHNLWPFEVVIAAFVGGAAAFAGALLGEVVLRLLRWARRGQ